MQACRGSCAEIFYKETNSQRTIRNLPENDFRLGIIRYAEHYDQSFRAMLEEKDLACEMLCAFSYRLLMNELRQMYMNAYYGKHFTELPMPRA